MRTLIQRVKQASVMVNQQAVAQIEQGILAYIGFGHDDDLAMAQRMLDKIIKYRIFEDKAGKLSQNVQQVDGGLLLVSQFTLLAQTNKGLRPDFKPAMAYAQAQQLFEQMCDYGQQQHHKVATGIFGADMQVSSINDGPINFILTL